MKKTNQLPCALILQWKGTDDGVNHGRCLTCDHCDFWQKSSKIALPSLATRPAGLRGFAVIHLIVGVGVGHIKAIGRQEQKSITSKASCRIPVPREGQGAA